MAMKKRSERRSSASKAEAKNLPTADPFPWALDGQNFISWRWSFTYKRSLVRINARNFAILEYAIKEEEDARNFELSW